MIITDRGILLQDGEVQTGVAGITKTKKVRPSCLSRALKLANNIAYDCTSDAAIKVRFGSELRGKECYPIIGKSEAGGLRYHVDAVYSEDIDSNWDGLTDILISRPDTNLAKLATVLIERAIQVSKSGILRATVDSDDDKHLSSLVINTSKETWLCYVGWKYNGLFSINGIESLSNMLWEYGHAIVGFDNYKGLITLEIATNKKLACIEYKTLEKRVKEFASNHLFKEII